MDSSKGRVLVVAAWGYPPQWYRYRYSVRVQHPRFAKLIDGYSCASCCSTLVLASALASKGFDVDVLVFGTDTVVDPSITDDVRSRALALYNGWLEELVDEKNCDCCKHLDVNRVELVVLPGIGRYFGWVFEASIDNVFNYAFRRLVDKVSGAGYGWIFLDLTHGINYLLISVLYATIATAVLLDLEHRVIMMNSEPAARGSGVRCIVEQKQQSFVSTNELNILDVTRLQQAVNFIRMLTSLKHFSTSAMGAVLKELRGVDPEFSRLLEEKIVPFFQLLGNAVVGPTYADSYVLEDDGSVKPIGVAVCRERVALEGIDEDVYRPKKVVNERKVVYGRTTVFESLRIALSKILNSVCRELQVHDFIEYLRKLSGCYEARGLLFAELVVNDTISTLASIAEYVAKCMDSIPQEYLRPTTDGIEMDAVLFRALSMHDYEVNAAIRAGRCIDRDRIVQYIEEALKRQIDEQKKIENARNGLIDYLRNMVAHAGLEYPTLEKFILTKRGDEFVISKVIYRGSILRKVLKSWSHLRKAAI